eukprot:Nk52_evm14s2241 gene=Nk52_evmTU14s2241
MGDHEPQGEIHNSRKPWRKVLYEDRGSDYEDNYVDESFLVDLKKNAHVRSHGYWKVCKESSRVINQLCLLSLFVSVYWLCEGDVLHARSPVVGCVLVPLLTMPYAYWFFRCRGGTVNFVDLSVTSQIHPWGAEEGEGVNGNKKHGRSRDVGKSSNRIGLGRYIVQNSELATSNLKSLILYVMILLAVCPILNTLTRSISTDTLYAMASFLLFFSLIVYDYKYSDVFPGHISGSSSDSAISKLRKRKSSIYSFDGVSSENKSGAGGGGETDTVRFAEAAIGQNHISFNCAMCASVCLGSRLQNLEDVFALNALCLVLFVHYAYFLRFLKQNGNAFDEKLYYWITFFNCVANALISFLFFSPLLAAVFVLCILCIAFVSPMLLLYMEQYKNEIHGPWDEAIIINHEGK